MKKNYFLLILPLIFLLNSCTPYLSVRNFIKENNVSFNPQVVVYYSQSKSFLNNTNTDGSIKNPFVKFADCINYLKNVQASYPELKKFEIRLIYVEDAVFFDLFDFDEVFLENTEFNLRLYEGTQNSCISGQINCQGNYKVYLSNLNVTNTCEIDFSNLVSLYLRNCNFFDLSVNSSVIKFSGQQLEITDTLFKNIKSINEISGIAVNFDGNDFILKNSIITDCKMKSLINKISIGSGGGIYVAHGNVTIENCKIKDCEAFYNGGGIYFDGNKLNIKNCEICDNTLLSTISDNTIKCGAGIYINGSNYTEVKISDTKISGNKGDGRNTRSDYKGIGIYVDTFSGEISKAIYFNNVTVEENNFYKGIFEDLFSTCDGCGIYLGKGNRVFLSGLCYLNDNKKIDGSTEVQNNCMLSAENSIICFDEYLSLSKKSKVGICATDVALSSGSKQITAGIKYLNFSEADIRKCFLSDYNNLIIAIGSTNSPELFLCQD